MKSYRVLCLTDHAKHSKENSLYAIVSAMSKHPRCEKIVVASRSVAVNFAFFEHRDFTKLYGLRIGNGFNYEEAKKSLVDLKLEINPAEFNIIFLRLPRPISDDFLRALESYFCNACIINRPSGIVKCSNKSVLLNFQDVCPPIKFCRSLDEIIAFAEKFELVLKPLKEYGGKGLLRVNKDKLNDGKNDYKTLAYLKTIERQIQEEGYLAMKFLKNVNQGDKRLIVVDGEILAASLRLPESGSWLCNVAVGGKSFKTDVDDRELEIVARINPFLNNHGILIYGADTLVDDNGARILSEINTLSIGGFPQAEEQTGKPIIKVTIDKIFNYADVQLEK